MTYKAVAASLILSSAMFTSVSFAEEDIEMIKYFRDVSSDICMESNFLEQCQFLIASIAELSRQTGKLEMVCKDDYSRKFVSTTGSTQRQYNNGTNKHIHYLNNSINNL